ncbi:hypothetical protein CK203_035934 [Vitis vinifera]|uniref:Endonuclease/exonuclease/phosphatase domain-containing protein n=1 Tax=Vitis vinifera TaxID=29760 RepID=A0A438I049_VITVI|nr:hypothetical protein CK203_035934 [Vitis vinifera]
MPEGLLQVSSKPKGSSVSVRRRARSGPPRFEEASSTLKRNFEGAVSEQDLPLSGAFEPNFIPKTFVSLVHPSRCHSFSSIPLESSYAFQRGSVFISPVVNNNHRGGASCSEGEASFPVQEPSTLPLEGFQVEGLTPRKMVKVQSVLESLRVRIVRDNGKGVEGENRSALSADKVYSRRKKKNDSGSRKKRRSVRRFLSTQNPDVVMLQETKREIWDRRSVSSVWKVKVWIGVALPACGASGGIVILWDSVKFNCLEKVVEEGLLDGASRPAWSDFPKVCGTDSRYAWEDLRQIMGDMSWHWDKPKQDVMLLKL